MSPLATPPPEIVRRAAEMKATGTSWEAIHHRLGGDVELLERFPFEFPEIWEPHYARANKIVLREALAEVVLTMRMKMRSENEDIACRAGDVLVKL